MAKSVVTIIKVWQKVAVSENNADVIRRTCGYEGVLGGFPPN